MGLGVFVRKCVKQINVWGRGFLPTSLFVMLCCVCGMVLVYVDGGVGRSSVFSSPNHLLFTTKHIYAFFLTKPNLFLSRFVCNL